MPPLTPEDIYCRRLLYAVITISTTLLLFFCILGLFLTSCTINFQTISSNGESSDLVDDVQEATGDVPISGIKPL